jgi:hypothetical protein
LIEEALLHVPQDLREVDINTSAGTSCYYRLQAGERYVIFAQKQDGPPLRLSIGACSNTFPLEGNRHILDALRNLSRGGLPRLVGIVRRNGGPYTRDGEVAGAVVTARSATTQYEAATDASGKYEIHGMLPGRYQIEVSKTGFAPDDEFNRRWSGRLALNEVTNTIEPDKDEPRGSVLIGERSCAVWDLAMWPRGRVSGTIRNAAGAPLEGVTVQAFASDPEGERDSNPLRTGTSNQAGRYTIEPLPGGEYVIGVNAETYRDNEPYPPTVFTGGKGGSAAARISVADGRETADIDLVLQKKRAGTTLKIEVRAPGGRPSTGAVVTLENPAGIERWNSIPEKSVDGVIEVPVYLGEQYVVRARVFDSGRNKSEEYDYLGGSTEVDVQMEKPTAVIVLAPSYFRDEQ